MKAATRKDFAYAMTPLKILSVPLGTWPLQNYNTFAAMRAAVTICLLVLMMTILVTEMYLDGSDAEKNLDTVVLVSSGILGISKIMFFRIERSGLINNFVSAVKDYNGLSSEEKRAIVRRHAYMGRMACVTVIFFSYFGSTLFMAVPMLAGAEEEEEAINVTEEDVTEYPIPSANTLDMVNMPRNMYLAIFFIEYLMLLATSTANLGSDSLFFGIIFHLCGQVEILGLEFSKLSNDDGGATKRFNLLTKRHIHLLNLAEMLNGTISSILIVQLLSSSVLICTSGFQFILALNDTNVVMSIKTFIVMTTLLAQLFAYSYIGDYLKRQMGNIGTSSYFSSWQDFPQSLAKSIVYIIMKAQDPVHLTAGKFFIVNMETYMNILKTSMSYLSVLRVMRTIVFLFSWTSCENEDILHKRFRLCDGTVKSSIVACGYLAPAALRYILNCTRLYFGLHTGRGRSSAHPNCAPVLEAFLSLFIFITVPERTLVLSQLSMLLLVQTEIYLDSSSAENNLDAMVINMCGILAVVKITYARVWPEGLISNFTSAVEDYNELHVEGRRKIMRRHAYMGRVACASVIITSYFSAALFATVSILVENVKAEDNMTDEEAINYPIPCEHALSIMRVPANLYLLIFVVEYCMLLVTCIGNLGSDSLFFGIYFHLCGQVEILKMEFSKLSSEEEIIIRERFNSLSKRHIYLFDLAEMLNETISSILIVQLFSSCVLICTSGFQFVLAINIGNVVMIVKTFIVLCTLLVQLFAYSYVGDYLKRQLEGIGNSAYSCRWYELPKHVAQDIVYTIMRSQSPVHLSAGKFFLVNMQTYMSIIKTSLSYLSVLRVMMNA